MSFAAWLTGRPASGKSAIARELVGLLHERGVEVSVLESDVMRTQLTPFLRYDDADRDFFYGTLAEIGAQLVNGGRPVVFDATANRRAYRDAGERQSSALPRSTSIRPSKSAKRAIPRASTVAA